MALALGGLVASLEGLNTNPAAPDWGFDDRIRLEMRPAHGPLNIYNRYALAGHFLFSGAHDARLGELEASLGALSASLRGAATADTRDGRIASTLGALSSSLRGTAFYSLFFDIEWSLQPNFLISEQTSLSGVIAATLGGLTPSLRGTALPPDSVSGRVATSLSALSADFSGTFTSLPPIDGNLHIDLSSLSASMRGNAVAPTGVIGRMPMHLGGITSSFWGTFEAWHTDGLLAATLGAVTHRVYGQSYPPGADIGVIDARLSGLIASLRGLSVAQVDVLLSDGLVFEPALGGTVAFEPALDAASIVWKPIT